MRGYAKLKLYSVVVLTQVMSVEEPSICLANRFLVVASGKSDASCRFIKYMSESKFTPSETRILSHLNNRPVMDHDMMWSYFRKRETMYSHVLVPLWNRLDSDERAWMESAITCVELEEKRTRNQRV